MTIAVIGVGFVGLVSAAVFAKFGNTVWAINRDEKKSLALKKGKLPFFEPGLEELVKDNVHAGRLNFTTKYSKAIPPANVIMIAVGTPSAPDGTADLSAVSAAAQAAAPHLKRDAIIIIKSTVPPGTNNKVKEIIKKHTSVNFHLASVPEFLREGTAVEDTLHPDRILIGASEPSVIKRLLELHRPLSGETVIMKPESAQLTKYAANAYLATRIVFINQIADLAEKTGADVQEIIRGIGLDRRIGLHYWWPGLQYGGSCFDADTTTYLLNSPHVTAAPISTYFPQPQNIESKSPQLALTDRKTLSFDNRHLNAVVTDTHALTKRWFEGQMVTITARMGRKLRLTSDHPVCILNQDNEMTVKPANQVRIYDRLILATTLPKLTPLTSINLLDFLVNQADDHNIKIRGANKYFARHALRFARLIPKTLYRHPYQIRTTDCVSLKVYRFLTDKKLLRISPQNLSLFTAKGKPTYCPAVIPLTAKFIRLLGYYAAEGWISIDKGRKQAVRQRIGFAFHRMETEYQNDLTNILQSLEVRFLEKIDGNTWAAIISSSPLAILIRDVLCCGINSNEKRLPKIIFNVNNKLKWEYLRGAWSGDGSISTIQSGRNLMLEYATTSKSLADGMSLLLQSLGIIPSIRRRMMNKSKHLAYILRINGASQIKTMINVFGKKRKLLIENTLNKYQKFIKQSGFTKYPTFAAVEVTNIDKQPAKEFVFSLETDSGLLLANSGIVVHNCFPKDVKELSAYARRVGEGDGLFEKIDRLNEERLHKILAKFENAIGGWKQKTVAILGLSFKPDTDDTREAPSLKVIPILKAAGATVKTYDPQAKNNHSCLNPYAAAADADILIILVEWDEFRSLDLNRIKKLMSANPVFIDTRNLYNPETVTEKGFKYVGIGR